MENKINLNNYEAWFLDYHEGNLDELNKLQVLEFLNNNPDLEIEFHAFEAIDLQEENIVLSDEFKENLKKESIINSNNISDWLIAELEGDLNLQELVLLRNFLEANPHYNKDKALFALTKLVKTDEQLLSKRNLIKGKIIWFNASRTSLAIAACLFLLFGAYLIFKVYNTNNYTKKELVQQVDTLKIIDTTKNVINQNLNNKLVTNIDTVINNNEVNENNKLVSTESIKNKNDFEKLQSPNSLYINIKPNNKIKNNSIQKFAFNKSTLEDQKDSIQRLPHINTAVIPQLRIYTSVIPYNAQQVTTLIAESERTKIDSEKILNEIKRDVVAEIDKSLKEDALTEVEVSKLTGKSKTYLLIANMINKVSGNKLKVKTTFNPLNGNIAAYEVETQNKIYQKQF